MTMPIRRALYRVPKGHRNLLCDPPGSSWWAAIEANRQGAAKWSFRVAGRGAVEFRQMARSEAFEAARRYADAGRFRVMERDSDVVIQTGHQPLLYHPGIWVKNMLVDEAARAFGTTALNVVVDSDSASDVGVEVANRGVSGGLTMAKEVLALLPHGTAFEGMARPSDLEFERFCGRVINHLATLDTGEPLYRFLRFRREALAVLAAMGKDENLANFLTFSRRRYEDTSNGGEGASTYLEVPISQVSRSTCFAAFVADLVGQAFRFAEVFNSALAEYRRVNRIRNEANPFPNLDVAPQRVELPLWMIDAGGARRTLFAYVLPNGMGLGPVGGPVFDMPHPAQDPAGACRVILESGLQIRPKAVALTIYSRLFLSDLFVHGVGGGKYDIVTDAVIEEFYGIPAPVYVVASLSYALPLSQGWASDFSPKAVETELRQMRYNPQRFIEGALVEGALPVTGEELVGLQGSEPPGSEIQGGELRGLRDRKLELIKKIQESGTGKRALTRQIEEVNDQLYQGLAPLVASKVTQLEQARRQEKLFSVAAFRAYPFFLFEPGEIRDVARGQIGTAGITGGTRVSCCCGASAGCE